MRGTDPIPSFQESLPVIFVTGGAGYIGSHFLELWLRTARSRLQAYQMVVLDNLSGGHLEVLEVLNHEAKKNQASDIIFEKIDLCDSAGLKKTFSKYRPQAVLHFAGKISVTESVLFPDLYYKNNVEGSENLLNAMQEFGCKRIVFSSTAAVYGNVDSNEGITEDFPLKPINPYGHSKLKIEQAIGEAFRLWGLEGIVFRYFNAAGAAESGLIGEWHEPETHLIPLVIETTLKPDGELKIFGQDYPTRDGTCIRDYIHVTDLAHAHILGLNRLMKNEVKATETYNLGTQKGVSVQEVVEMVKKVTGKQVKINSCPRRSGDAASLIASSKKAQRILGWEATHSDIETILKTAYVWHQHYASSVKI